jgi:signal transduction histidine kinase
MLGIVSDITERKEAEEALRISEQNLRESNATKDKFFSIIAHDLKNPFNSILGFSQILIDDFEIFDEAKLKSIAGQINSGARHLYKLLENLLQWSRAQTGKIKYIPKEVDVKLIVDNYVMIMGLTAEDKNIKIHSTITDKMMLYIDWNMIESVIRNLLSNAIKFSHEGGKIEVSKEETDDFVTFSVKDEGVGISAKNIDKLFRIDTTFTTKGTANERGTGLGLILCKEFVERHGGNIWVESEVGKGSTFKFTLPKYDSVTE